MKVKLLEGLRARKTPLGTSDVGLDFEEKSTIFVNEKLTPHMQRVFTEAKAAKKDDLIKYVCMCDAAPTLVFYNSRDIEKAVENSTDDLENEDESAPRTGRSRPSLRPRKPKRKNFEVNGDQGAPPPTEEEPAST